MSKQTETQAEKIKRVYGKIQRDRLRKGLSFFCVLTLILSIGLILYKTVYLKVVNDQDTDHQKSLYYDDTGGDSVSGAPDDADDKFARLYAQNADIRGWITLPSTRIDSPVYQPPATNPDYYLTHSGSKKRSSHGSIYLDARIQLDNHPRVLFLHGHNMNDGTIFHDLGKYKSLAFFKENPIFSFDTVLEDGSWKIFSVFLINTRPEHGEVFNYLRTEFADDSDFLDFIGQLQSRSLIDAGVDVRIDDQLLLLSTCSYEHKDFRMVVAARKVRVGEDSVLNPDTVYLAENPVRPGICMNCRHMEEG